MNTHHLPRSIFLTRHGESEFNQAGRLGGDSPLSPRGLQYADCLYDYFHSEAMPNLQVWTSQRLRVLQTARRLSLLAASTQNLKALDEIDAGVCDGLTYEEVATRYPQQLANRDQDKYHYRYPSGESYEDIVARLEPVIMELEREPNVLVVSHQAVLRCILAHFLGIHSSELPYIRVPLHAVIKLTPIGHGWNMQTIKFDVGAVDTQRAKPVAVSSDRSKEDALSTVPPVDPVSG